MSINVRAVSPDALASIERAFVRAPKDKERFIAAELLPRFGREWDAQILERVFALADTNANGTVELAEWVVLQFVLSAAASRDEHLRFVFNLFDMDADERISKKEFRKIELALLLGHQSAEHADAKAKYAPLADLLAACAFAVHDRKDEQSIGFAEWRRFAEEDEGVQRFLECMQPPANDFPTLVGAGAGGGDLLPPSPFANF